MKRNIKPNAEGKFEGIVYRYYINDKNSVDYGKSYVGNTPDEKERRRCWNKPSGSYAGKKLQDAKAIYSPVKWNYEKLETVIGDTVDELERMLNEREAYYIEKYDSVNNGFNTSSGGTGNKDVRFSQAHKNRISKNHRKTQTAATKARISKSLKGHQVSASTKQKISQGLSGIKRTPEQIQAMSDRMKGKVPEAATNGAKEWVKQNGGGYWSNHPLPQSARDNMKKAQQRAGVKVKVSYADGRVEYFPTMLDAAKAFGVKAGSISHYIKRGKMIDKHKCKFDKITKDEYAAAMQKKAG